MNECLELKKSDGRFEISNKINFYIDTKFYNDPTIFREKVHLNASAISSFEKFMAHQNAV